MGRADGILLGSAILAGILLGAPAIVVAPAICLLHQALLDRIVLSRVVLCAVLAGLGALREPDDRLAVAGSGVAVSAELAVGQVASMPRPAGGGQRFLFAVQRTSDGDTWQDVRFSSLVTMPGDDVNVGDVLWLAWSLDLPADLSPGYLAYVRSQGADTAAYAFAGEVVEPGTSWLRPFVALRRTLSETLMRAAPGDSGALLAGLVTGDDSELGERADDAFRRTGTAHITAVSGSNLALVAGLWGVLGAAAGWRRRWWLHAGIVVSVWAYAVVVGLEPPAVRAAIVASLTALSIRFGRRPDPLTLVLLAAAGMALADPPTTRTLSFQLSLAASAALVSCLPREAEAGAAAWLRGTLTGVVAAHFATLPLVVATFGSWSPMGIPANLAILPLVPPTFALAFAAALVGPIWPALGDVLGTIAGFGAGWMITIVEHLAQFGGPITVGWDTGPALLLVWFVSVTAVGVLSVDTRRWVADIADAWQAGGPLVTLLTASLFSGMLLVVLALSQR